MDLKYMLYIRKNRVPDHNYKIRYMFLTLNGLQCMYFLYFPLSRLHENVLTYWSTFDNYSVHSMWTDREVD